MASYLPYKITSMRPNSRESLEDISIDAVLSIIFLFAALPVLYGLHRLGLYLESRDLIYYWHKKPSGGSAYNPLQELVQPQVRHVIEVGGQRQGESTDRAGGAIGRRSE